MLWMTFVSSLQPDVGRGFLHVSNVFLLNVLYYVIWNDKYTQIFNVA